MARIISIMNQKGGVGKTTTAVNLSVYLASFGKFVLLVDMDPQGNATSGLGVNPREIDKGIYESIIALSPLSTIIRRTSHESHAIAPASPALAGADIELVPLENREFKLREALAEARGSYDYIIIDSPPSLGLLTINGLVAADEVLIPVQCEYYALEGLSSLVETIKLVQENLRPDLTILGALMTMYDDRYRLTKEVFHEMYRYFPERIFRNVIPRNISLAEAPSYGKSILAYDPRSKGAKAYERLAREVRETERNF